jgi:hypothetical protein
MPHVNTFVCVIFPPPHNDLIAGLHPKVSGPHAAANKVNLNLILIIIYVNIILERKEKQKN